MSVDTWQLAMGCRVSVHRLRLCSLRGPKDISHATSKSLTEATALAAHIRASIASPRCLKNTCSCSFESLIDELESVEVSRPTMRRSHVVRQAAVFFHSSCDMQENGALGAA